jgi:hypothetical protein
MEELKINLTNGGTIWAKVKYNNFHQMLKDSALNMHLHSANFTLFKYLQSW